MESKIDTLQEDNPEIVLGFLSQPKNSLVMTSKFLPNKVGGYPVNNFKCMTILFRLGLQQSMPLRLLYLLLNAIIVGINSPFWCSSTLTSSKKTLTTSECSMSWLVSPPSAYLSRDASKCTEATPKIKALPMNNSTPKCVMFPTSTSSDWVFLRKSYLPKKRKKIKSHRMNRWLILIWRREA